MSYFYSGGLEDGGEAGLLGGYSPQSPVKPVSTIQSPTSPNGIVTNGKDNRTRSGRLEFSPDKVLNKNSSHSSKFGEPEIFYRLARISLRSI